MKNNIKSYIGAAFALLLFVLAPSLAQAITTEPQNAVHSAPTPEVLLQTPSLESWPLVTDDIQYAHIAITERSGLDIVSIQQSAEIAPVMSRKAFGMTANGCRHRVAPLNVLPLLQHDTANRRQSPAG